MEKNKMKLYALTLAALLATVSFAQAEDSTPKGEMKAELTGAPTSEEDVKAQVTAPEEAPAQN
jgi:hypothetical protein